jgi:hypothetical protein
MKWRSVMADDLKIESGEHHLSEAAKKRVSESLKKTLADELAKEHSTLGGSGANAAIGVGGHANVTTVKMK